MKDTVALGFPTGSFPKFLWFFHQNCIKSRRSTRRTDCLEPARKAACWQTRPPARLNTAGRRRCLCEASVASWKTSQLKNIFSTFIIDHSQRSRETYITTKFDREECSSSSSRNRKCRSVFDRSEFISATVKYLSLIFVIERDSSKLLSRPVLYVTRELITASEVAY